MKKLFTLFLLLTSLHIFARVISFDLHTCIAKQLYEHITGSITVGYYSEISPLKYHIIVSDDQGRSTLITQSGRPQYTVNITGTAASGVCLTTTITYNTYGYISPNIYIGVAADSTFYPRITSAVQLSAFIIDNIEDYNSLIRIGGQIIMVNHVNSPYMTFTYGDGIHTTNIARVPEDNDVYTTLVTEKINNPQSTYDFDVYIDSDKPQRIYKK